MIQIELATNADRLEEYRRISSFNRRCGVDVHEISPQEVKKLFPLCETGDLLAGFYVENDGRVNPVDASMSLAKGARMTGNVLYFEGPQYRVEHVLSKDSKSGMDRVVTGVKLTDGTEIQADYVVQLHRHVGSADGAASGRYALETGTGGCGAQPSSRALLLGDRQYPGGRPKLASN